MNITNLTGRLTKDIELRTTQSGKTVANFTLAVNRRFKSQGQPDADFFRCQAWGKTAEVLHQYTHKGSQIGVTGRLQNRSYENQQGQNVEITEVVVESMDLLDSRNNPTQPADRPKSTYAGYSHPSRHRIAPTGLEMAVRAASNMTGMSDPVTTTPTARMKRWRWKLTTCRFERGKNRHGNNQNR